MKTRILFVLLITIVLLQCGGGRHTIPRFMDDSITRVDVNALYKKAQNINFYGNANLLLLLEKVVYKLDNKNRITLQVHQISKVLDEKIGKISKSFIQYHNGHERIAKIEAFTLSPDQKTKVKANISTKSPFYNPTIRLELYKNLRVKEVSFKQVQKGSILNLRYQMEINYSEINGIVEGGFYLNNRFPILKLKGVIILPKGKEIKFKQVHTGKSPKKITQDDFDYYVIEQNNSPILKNEAFQPPFQEICPKIVFSTLKSWSELNSKLYPLMASRLTKEAKVEQLARKLTTGMKSSEEKLAALYNYVTNTKNISNVAIAFGMVGYIPNPSAKILSFRYGDSRDKAILLINLLRAVGINAKIALTNETYNLDPEIPSLKSLNRILVAVHLKEKYQILDPHSAIVRYGYLPSNNYGKHLLILDPKKPKMIKIPTMTANDNQIIYETKSSLNNQGELKYTTKFIPKGYYEVSERITMMKVASKNSFRSLRENYQSTFEQSPNIKLVKLKSPDPYDIQKPYQYSVTFLVKKFCIKKNNSVFIQPELHHRKLYSFSSNRRTHDIDFILPFKIISKHDMKFPAQWKISKLPKTVTMSSPLWTYVRQFKKNKNSIQYLRKLELKVPRISKKDYPKFKRFLDKVMKSDKKMLQFFIKKNSAKKDLKAKPES